MPLIRKGSAKSGGAENPSRSLSDKKPQTSAPKSEPKGELAEVIGVFQKNIPGSIFVASKRPVFATRVPTGILSLDAALAGGFKRSRVSMVYGERSTGKSTLVSRTLASVQREQPDKHVVIVDIEGTFDKTWFEMQGGDPERLVIVEPDSGEMAVDMADALVRAEECAAIAVDSIAMLSPQAEIDASAEDNLMGLQARMVGRFLRKLNQAILAERKRSHYPLAMLINQYRMKIGMVFGDPRTLPGGKALSFVTSQEVETKNKEHKDSNDMVVFNEHTCAITKDKTGGRIKEAKFKLIRDESQNAPVGFIDQAKTILDMGTRIGLVKGRTIEGYGSFRSADDLRTWCIDNPDKERELVSKIVSAYRSSWKIED